MAKAVGAPDLRAHSPAVESSGARSKVGIHGDPGPLLFCVGLPSHRELKSVDTPTQTIIPLRHNGTLHIQLVSHIFENGGHGCAEPGPILWVVRSDQTGAHPVRGFGTDFKPSPMQSPKRKTVTSYPGPPK